MTIDQVLELISPYVNISGVITVVTVFIAIAVRCRGLIKATAQDVSQSAKNVSETAMLNEEKIVELMSKVLPKDMAVKIMPLVESELKRIAETVQEAAAATSARQTDKLDAIATAVASMRNLPTEQREKLLALIEDKNKDEAQTVVVQYEVSEAVKAIAEEQKTVENTVEQSEAWLGD